MVSEAKKKAVTKYDDKTYNKCMVRLRKEDNKDLIQAIEASGLSCTAFLKRLWEQNHKG